MSKGIKTVEIKDLKEGFDEILMKLEANPYCKYAGCYGRGYTGIAVEPDGSKKYLILCKCAKFKDNALSKLYDKIMELEKTHTELIKKSEEMNIDLESKIHEYFNHIEHLFESSKREDIKSKDKKFWRKLFTKGF